MQRAGTVAAADVPLAPIKSRGAPGVALLDYDRDGDLDIYVTNGPGTPNSLYRNLVSERGEVRFKDVAERAGVDATDQDGTGTCFGDIDNDGDHDLLVLGYNEPHRLFENRGNGRFRDISAASGISHADGATVHSSPVRLTVGPAEGNGPARVEEAVLRHVENRIKLPGMTATVEFLVETATDVLYVANASLRYQPDQEAMAAAFDRLRTERESREPGGSASARPAAVAGGSASNDDRGLLWTIDENGELAAIPVRTGISDGIHTAVSGRELDEGMQVIAGASSNAATTSAVSSPFQQQQNGRGPGPPTPGGF